MEKQAKLIMDDEDLFQGKLPEVQVVKNTYMSAGALIREMIIKKVWIVPAKNVGAQTA